MLIKTIFLKQRLINEKIDWSKILNPKQPFKTLYSLQIVHSIIACGVLDEKEQFQEVFILNAKNFLSWSFFLNYIFPIF